MISEPEAIQNFDEEQAVNIIANTFDNGFILNGINHNPAFHPILLLIGQKWGCFTTTQ